MNYAYNNNFGNPYSNPYTRPFSMPNFSQPQYMPQNQQTQPQPMAQQPQQPMQQAMPMDTPIQYVGYATLKEAEAYILMPNTKGLFIDKNSGMVYEKICLNDGQSFINHYQKVDQNVNEKLVEERKEENSINIDEFVKKKDLEEYATVGQWEELTKALSCIQAQIKGFTATQKQSTSEPKPKAEPKTEKSK